MDRERKKVNKLVLGVQAGIPILKPKKSIKKGESQSGDGLNHQEGGEQCVGY